MIFPLCKHLAMPKLKLSLELKAMNQCQLDFTTKLYQVYWHVKYNFKILDWHCPKFQLAVTETQTILSSIAQRTYPIEPLQAVENYHHGSLSALLNCDSNDPLTVTMK